MATGGDADIAAVGALLGDPRRCRILLALGDGRALPATRLADEAGVGAATTSEHLAKLVAGGLLAVQPHGRHRYYRLAGPQVAELLEHLMRMVPQTPVRSMTAGTRSSQLRAARSCYDHLAGRLGVAIMDALIDAGHVTATGSGAASDGPVGAGHDVEYRIADSGRAAFAGLGVPLPASAPVRYCVDWSEQRHHLAGVPGRLLLRRMLELDWVRRAPGNRAVRVTAAGREGLADALGVEAA